MLQSPLRCTSPRSATARAWSRRCAPALRRLWQRGGGLRLRLAALRGRQLRGRALELPDGVRGAVLQDTVQASVADGEERRWVHTGSFDALTYWKHDDAPTAHDAAARTLEWVKLAQVLHAEHADEAAPPIEHRTSVEAS